MLIGRQLLRQRDIDATSGQESLESRPIWRLRDIAEQTEFGRWVTTKWIAFAGRQRYGISNRGLGRESSLVSYDEQMVAH
jgi:hypothetical protein